MKFTFDSTIPSSVKLDEHENFVSIEGSRRVLDVEVLNDEGVHEKLNPEKKYTIASHNYLLLDNGSGATMFDNSKIIVNDGMLDVEMLEIYITEFLNGKIGSEYSESQNRIIAK
jgi:2',3'-cyclic-nucleotide 2'-phosphodiesterase (5'-nucleotidase family)